MFGGLLDKVRSGLKDLFNAPAQRSVQQRQTNPSGQSRPNLEPKRKSLTELIQSVKQPARRVIDTRVPAARFIPNPVAQTVAGVRIKQPTITPRRLANEAANLTVRPITRAGFEATQSIRGDQRSYDPSKDFKDPTIARALFGTEPLRNYKDPKRPARVILKKAGVSDKTANKVAPVLIGAGAALDVTGILPSGVGKNAGTKGIGKVAKLLGGERNIEKDSAEYLVKNLDELKKLYVKRFGNVLNPDNAKELFRATGYNPEKDTTTAKRVHEPASKLTKEVFRKLLDENTGGQNKRVLFTAGGSGVGKTKAVDQYVNTKDYPLVYDSNMSTTKSAFEKLDNALERGFKPEIAYVYRDPIKAWEEGVLKRTARGERHVPLDTHLNMHAGSLDTIKEIAKKYGDKVDIKVIDNNAGPGEAKLVGLDFLDNIAHNKDDLLNKLYESSNKAIQEGKITADRLPELEGLGPNVRRQIEQGSKERGFITTAKSSENTAPQVKEQIAGFYSPITNKATLEEADAIISSNLDEALKIAKEGESTAVNNAISLRLISKFQQEGDFNQAIDLIESLAKKPTSQGQAIQVLSLYNRLTPEGALRYAQRLVDRSNQGKVRGFRKVGDIAAERIDKIARELQTMPEGEDKMIKTAELVEEIHSVVPSTILQKISTIQTIAQLLNPKTAIRNIGGNFGFAAGEFVSDAIAAPVDAVLSLITGKRTKAFPNPIVGAKGFGLGLKQGIKEAIKGVNSQPNVTSQFDLPATRTFKNPIAGIFEKALNLELRATDRAFYRAAFENSLNQSMRAAGVKEPTQEMLELAHYDGLYRTFQDENTYTKAFQTMKRALNLGKSFGLGDLVLKYPKTPANLIARGVDYSPAGFINMAFQMVRPLVGKPFDQKQFVENFSRALVGTTGLITTGVLLNKLGVITGKPEKDKDISQVQKLSGLGSYRINVDALKRLVFSGFSEEAAAPQEGDTLVSYDWFQPFAIALSMGANIGENNGKIESGGQVASILASLQGGVDTIFAQPLVQGVRQLTQGYDPTEAMIATLKQTPSSFVPTFLSQVNQFTSDNITRNTYDRNPFKEALNIALSKIPGASDSLPIKYDVYGQPQERFQDGTNGAFNVFLNPAFISTLKSDPTGNEVLGIFNRSGETQQAPKVVDKKISISQDGVSQDYELTAEEQAIYQEYIGLRTKAVFDALVNDAKFQSLTDEDKAKNMANFITDINTAAKIELFGHRPQKLDSSVKDILTGDVDFGRVRATGETAYRSGGGGGRRAGRPSKPSTRFSGSGRLRIRTRRTASTGTRKRRRIRLVSGNVNNGAFKVPTIKIAKSKKEPSLNFPKFT